MRVVMVMFDSLNRHFLPPYGCEWTHCPNFRRLAEKTVTFEKSYVCSMPCMPCRRDLHTGRPSFLHRSWGPIEPFDDSMPEMLKRAGVHTHLTTDHYHYFEDGGATYHTRYSTWEFYRGQEGDPWMGLVGGVAPTERGRGQNALDHAFAAQDRVNRLFMRNEEDMPQSKTFRSGGDFIRRNREKDGWFLQIETFDPHEPFYAHNKYRSLYGGVRPMRDIEYDWPAYSFADDPEEDIEHVRSCYAALVSMCDAKLGDVLDLFDELGMWDDTMLIVWTDHGFCLGEHGCWAKVWMPFVEEVSHTPFFVWDPRVGKAGERRGALVQPAIDLAPTVLRAFGVEPTERMLGSDLSPVLERDEPVRETGIFGVAGAQVNITDGERVYWRAAQDGGPEFSEHTLMPTCHMHGFFSTEELAPATLHPGFGFTRGCPVLRFERPWPRSHPDVAKSLLFDLHADPGQASPIRDGALEARFVRAIGTHFDACEAPAEMYVRYGVAAGGATA